jgi:phosphoribosylamine-glycine ligase
MQLIETKKLSVLNNPDIEYTLDPFPKFILDSLDKYRDILTAEELHFFLNCIRSAGLEGAILHLYHKKLQVWIPLNMKCEGNIGMFGSDDMPWYINDKACRGMSKYFDAFEIELSNIEVPTCAVDLDVIRNYSPAGANYEVQYDTWVSSLGRSRKKQLADEIVDQIPHSIVYYPTSQDYFMAVSEHCSSWLKQWSSVGMDQNFKYYGELVGSFKGGSLNMDFEGCHVRLFFLTDEKNFIFADPIIKDGEAPQFLGKLNNLYMVAHALVLKEGLRLGVKYFDCGILYETKRFLNLPFCNLNLINSKYADEVPHKILEKQIEEARADGKDVMIHLTVYDGAAAAFADNMRDCKTHKHIEIPCRNIEQLLPLYGNKLDTVPFYFSLQLGDNIPSMYMKPNDYFFDVDYTLIEDMFAFNDPRKLNKSFYTKGARQLEKNRYFAKEVASKIGITNPKYKVLKPDDYSVAEFGDKIVLKHNVHHLIGIYDKTALPNLQSYADGNHIVEEFIGAPDREIAYTVAFNEDFVMPLMTMWENNRMWENGSKTGSVATMHKAGIDDPFGLEVVEKLKSLHKHVPGLFGWCDISFMERDGKMYLLEFMMRMGHSNTCTILRQMKTPYMDFINALRRKDDAFKMEWHSKFACGIDLHGVPVESAFTDSWIRIDQIVDEAKSKYFPENVFFDYMHPYATRAKDAVYSQHSSWYGVVTALSNDHLDAMHMAEEAAGKVNLPMVHFRKGAFEGMDIK